MNKQEFRQLIREQIRKVLNEGRYDTIAATIKYDPKKVVSYKVGAGNRNGAPVSVSALKQVIGKPGENIKLIEDSGVKFTKAYAQIRGQSKSYLGTGSGTTMTYSLFGKDSQGNEIIYDKYEGDTAGGGQAFIFINGKKMKASEYLNTISKIQYKDVYQKVYNILKKVVPDLTLDAVSNQSTKGGKLYFDIRFPDNTPDKFYTKNDALQMYQNVVSVGKKLVPLLEPLLVPGQGLSVVLWSYERNKWAVELNSASTYIAQMPGTKQTILIPGNK